MSFKYNNFFGGEGDDTSSDEYTPLINPQTGVPKWVYIVIGVVILTIIGLIIWYATSSTVDPTTAAPTTTAPTTADQTTTAPTTSAPTTAAPTTAAPTTAAPTTAAPTTPVPINCQVSDWTPCNCLSNNQTRTITTQPNSSGTACPPLTQTCTPSAQQCNDWYTFNNTYISDGEYISRTCTNTFNECYSKCNGGGCAAVYAYDGHDTGPCSNNIECSTINANNTPKLYDRYGTMSNSKPNNRHAYVSKSALGSNFNPNIGTMVTIGSVA